MIVKNKFLLFTIFFIVIIQVLLYTNNNQNTSFRYFKWNIQKVSVGKLINVSFFSGLLISALLNNTNTTYKKNNFKKLDEDYENLDNEEEDIESNIEMPPQRDIRDSQPTISVNYRVVKNTSKSSLGSDQKFSNNSDYKDDWGNNDNDW